MTIYAEYTYAFMFFRTCLGLATACLVGDRNEYESDKVQVSLDRHRHDATSPVSYNSFSTLR